jgi:rhodanese-related sulfurtransferase
MTSASAAQPWQGRTDTVDAVPTVIDRERLRRLVGGGAQLVEVLPTSEYEEDHLPGAVNLPLRQIERRADALLDRNRPVIVYCWDVA